MKRTQNDEKIFEEFLNSHSMFDVNDSIYLAWLIAFNILNFHIQERSSWQL